MSEAPATPNTPNRPAYTRARGKFVTAPRESAIEALFCKQVKDHGGMTLKLAATGLAGVPDRIVLGAGGRMAFVEFKAPGQKPTALQEHRHAQLRAQGFVVWVVSSREQARNVAAVFNA